jgi:hypothetical protein
MTPGWYVNGHVRTLTGRELSLFVYPIPNPQSRA